MSGIAAIIHFDGRPVAPGDIEAMTASMTYRGPDGIRHWQDGNVALGHCLMCTTTESLEERQPVCDARGDVWLIVDGWLDNWKELRSELVKRGAELRNRTDPELILAAYRLWGEDSLAHLEGDFAFVIWNARRQTAFCARDKMGNKPFHFYWSASTLVIASEVRAVMALPWVPREINEGLLAERLAGDWWSRSETLWTHLSRLPAAHRLAASGAGIRVEEYWRPDVTAVIRYKTDQEYFDHYRSLYFDRVRRSARSHRPVAYSVSGGVDSSSLVCAAKHLLDRRDLPAPGIRAYTLDFSADDDPAANELDYVRLLSRFLGVDIQEVPRTVKPLSWYATQAAASCDQPDYPNSVMGRGLLLVAVNDGARVIVDGCGGDEWLDGTRSYYAEELAAGQFRNVVACLTTDVRTIGPAATLRAFLRHGLFLLLPEALQDQIRAVVRGPVRARDPAHDWLSARTRLLANRRRSTASSPELTRTIGQQALLEILYGGAFREWARESEERISAGLGMEPRRPLDSPAFIQFALSTPERLRLRGDRSRFTHVMAMEGLVPREILERKTKAEFSAVIWGLLDQLEGWFDQASVLHSGYLDADGLRKLYRDYRSNPRGGLPMWTLLNIYGSFTFMEMTT